MPPENRAALPVFVFAYSKPLLGFYRKGRNLFDGVLQDQQSVVRRNTNRAIHIRPRLLFGGQIQLADGRLQSHQSIRRFHIAVRVHIAIKDVGRNISRYKGYVLNHRERVQMDRICLGIVIRFAHPQDIVAARDIAELVECIGTGDGL